MRNVVFIFGAYDVMTDDAYWSLGEEFASDGFARADVVKAVFEALKN